MGWEDAFNNAVDAALGMWDNATRGAYNPLAGNEEPVVQGGNWWDDVGQGVGQALGNAGQAIGSTWQQFTSPQQPEIQDWYNEPAGQSAQDRVNWEMQRREQEFAAPREMPIWEQGWNALQQGADWWNTNVGERAMGLMAQTGLDWNEQLPYQAAQLAMPGLGGIGALGSTLKAGQDVFNKWQSGQSVMPDWNTAPEAWRQYKGANEEPFPGYYGLSEMAMDPTNLIGFGVATKGLKALPATRGMAEAAMGLRGMDELNPLAKVGAKALEWFDVPHSQRFAGQAMNEMREGVPFEEGAARATRAMNDTMQAKSIYDPRDWGRTTRASEAQHTMDVFTNAIPEIADLAGSNSMTQEVLLGLKRGALAGGEAFDQAVIDALGGNIPRTRNMREVQAFLSRVDDETIKAMAWTDREIQAVRELGLGINQELNAKIIGDAQNRVTNLTQSIAGGYKNKAGQIEPGMFGVKERTAPERYTSAIRSILIWPWMKLNPGYGMNNMTYNLFAEGLVTGKMPGLAGIKSATRELETVFGYRPSRGASAIVGGAPDQLPDPSNLLGHLDVTKWANKAEQSSGLHITSNVAKEVQGQQLGKWAIPEQFQQFDGLIKSIAGSVSAGTFPEALSQAIRTPGSIELSRVLQTLPPWMRGSGTGSLSDLAARGDVNGFMDTIARVLADPPGGTPDLAGVTPLADPTTLAGILQQMARNYDIFIGTPTTGAPPNIRTQLGAIQQWLLDRGSMDAESAVRKLVETKASNSQMFMQNILDPMFQAVEDELRRQNLAPEAIAAIEDVKRQLFSLEEWSVQFRKWLVDETSTQFRNGNGDAAVAYIRQVENWWDNAVYDPMLTSTFDHLNEIAARLGVDTQTSQAIAGIRTRVAEFLRAQNVPGMEATGEGIGRSAWSQGAGAKTPWRYEGPIQDSVAATSELIPIENLPNELYHVTVNEPGIMESGLIRPISRLAGEYKAGLGAVNFRDSVSFTTDKAVAESIQFELQRAANLAKDYPENMLASNTIMDDSILWQRLVEEDSARYAYTPIELQEVVDKAKDTLMTYGEVDISDLLKNYLMAREQILGISDPAFTGTIGDLLQLNPDSIKILTTPKSQLEKLGARITTGEPRNKEIRIWGEVPTGTNNIPTAGPVGQAMPEPPWGATAWPNSVMATVAGPDNFARAAMGEQYQTFRNWATGAMQEISNLTQIGPSTTDPATANALIQWARTAGRTELGEMKQVAVQAAEKARDFALFDYSQRRNIDSILSLIYPFPYWYTRAFKQWAEILLHRPQYLGFYANIRKEMEEHNKNLPERLRYSLPIPWFKDKDGNELRIDPIKRLLPMSSIFDPFMPEEQQTTLPGRAISATSALGFRPFPYLTQGAAMTGALGKPEAWMDRWFPQTKAIQSLTAGRIGSNPRGIDIEEIFPKPILRLGSAAFGNKVDIPYGDRWDDYRAQRWLREEASAGRIPAEQAKEAIANKTGAIWDKALTASIQRGAWPELTGMSGLRAQSFSPEERRYYTELKPAYQAMMKEAQAGGGKKMQTDFFQNNPDYGVWTFGKGTQEDAKKQLAQGQYIDESKGSKQYYQTIYDQYQAQGIGPWTQQWKDREAEQKAASKALQAKHNITFEPTSLRAMSQPELQQYIRDDQLREVNGKFWDINNQAREAQRLGDTAKYTELNTQAKKLIADNPDIQEYWRRNDMPIEAAWRLQNMKIMEFWDAYHNQIPKEQKRQFLMNGFLTIPDAAGDSFIQQIMTTYPGKWTEDQLRSALSNVKVPGVQTQLEQGRKATGTPGASGTYRTFTPSQPRLGKTNIPYEEWKVYFDLTDKDAKYNWLKAHGLAKGPNWNEYERLTNRVDKDNWLRANGQPLNNVPMPGTPGKWDTIPKSFLSQAKRAGSTYSRPVSTGGGGGAKAPTTATSGTSGTIGTFGTKLKWADYYALPKASVDRQEWLEAAGVGVEPNRFHWDRWSKVASTLGPGMTEQVKQYIALPEAERSNYLQSNPAFGTLLSIGATVNRFANPKTLDDVLALLEDLWKKASAYQASTATKSSPKVFLGA